MYISVIVMNLSRMPQEIYNIVDIFELHHNEKISIFNSHIFLMGRCTVATGKREKMEVTPEVIGYSKRTGVD